MKKRLILRLIIYILIVLNVAFIWSMSLFSREASSGQSMGIVGRLFEIFPSLRRFSAEVLEVIIRKLAHFCEFASLGALSAFAVWEHTSRHGDAFFGFAFPVLLSCLAVASTDETIQLFFDRGCRIRDVMLDFSGAVFGFFAVSLLRAIILFIRSKKNTATAEE